MHITAKHRALLSFLFFFTIHVSAENKKLSEPTSVDLSLIKIEDVKGVAPDFTSQKFLVFIESGSKCPILRRFSRTIEGLTKDYAGKVQFYFVDSAAHDDRTTASKEGVEYNFAAPILMDSDQRFARALGFTISTQAAIINTQTKEITYRGAIDDSFSFDGRREPRRHFLKDALEATLAGKTPDTRTTRAYGCAITFK